MEEKNIITEYREHKIAIDTESMSKYISKEIIAKYSPDPEFMPMTCQIEFKNINRSILSGLRRAILSQIPVYALACESKNGISIDTNDSFIFSDFICDRIAMIPIMQSIPPGAKFKISIKNTTTDPIPIYSSAIEQTAGQSGRYFYGGFIICNLNPGAYLNIANIYVDKGIAYNSHARYTVATGATLIPIDVTMLNVRYPVGDSRRGVSASQLNPTKYRLAFTTHGTMAPRAILIYACEELIKRILALRDLLPTITSEARTHTFILSEDETIGEIVQKCGLEIFPNVGKLIYKVSESDRTLRFDIYTDIEIVEFFDKIIDYAYSVYIVLLKQLRAK